MNINELIKESHDNAVEKGFYDCVECGGSGKYYQKNPDCISCGVCFEHCEKSVEICEVPTKCEPCNGTGKDQNKNIPELLMLVITEISEAVEALRDKKFSTMKLPIDVSRFADHLQKEEHNFLFKYHIKDTFEDEIADTFIRLFDLCGYLEIEIDEREYIGLDCAQNKSEALFDIIKMLCNLESSPKDQLKFRFLDIFKHLEYFCEVNNIDIEKHVTAKMEYNRYV